jgi:ABC-type phosphate transport system auxiliary subunit
MGMLAQAVDMMPVVGALIALGTLIVTWQKVSSNFKKDKSLIEKEILAKAKAYFELERVRLEAKIDFLKQELDNIESNINKDIEHSDERKEADIKSIRSEMESLKSDMQQYFSHILQILSKIKD